jgi:hypothetical protein
MSSRDQTTEEQYEPLGTCGSPPIHNIIHFKWSIVTLYKIAYYKPNQLCTVLAPSSDTPDHHPQLHHIILRHIRPEMPPHPRLIIRLNDRLARLEALPPRSSPLRFRETRHDRLGQHG